MGKHDGARVGRQIGDKRKRKNGGFPPSKISMLISNFFVEFDGCRAGAVLADVLLLVEVADDDDGSVCRSAADTLVSSLKNVWFWSGVGADIGGGKVIEEDEGLEMNYMGIMVNAKFFAVVVCRYFGFLLL